MYKMDIFVKNTNRMSSSWLFLFVLFGMGNNVFPAEITFPDHVTVDMSLSGFLECSLTLTSDESITPHGILWTKNDNIEIALSDSVTNGDTIKYALGGLSVTQNVSAVAQTLLIVEVGENDLGTYQCTFILNGQETNVKASTRLYITNYVPTPMCYTPEKPFVLPDDIITLRCDSDPADPLIEMMWSIDGNTISTNSQNANNPLSLNYVLTVPNTEGVNSYICQTSNTLDNVQACMINIFVESPLNLLIMQTPEIAVIGQDVTFTCLVSSGTVTSSYAWTFQDAGISYKIDGSALTIHNVQASYDGLNLICTVATSTQEERKSIKLTLSTPITTLAQTTPTSLPTTKARKQISKVATQAIRTTEIMAKITSVAWNEITSNPAMSTAKSEKQESTSVDTMVIIIAAVCGSIFLLLSICILIICLRTGHQKQPSEQNLSARMEYYKNVSVENEVKGDMVVNHLDINFLPNNFDISVLQTENDIYYKDDGWEPPPSAQTTTL